MGICAQCTFFRRVKPASQLLARVIATTDAAVSNALTKIVEDEQKQRDAEAEFKRSQATGDNDKWVTRPVVSDYCGFKESDGMFLIAEVKNFGGGCSDFVEGRPARRACADCRHRVLPQGPREDLAVENKWMDLGASTRMLGHSSTVEDNYLVKYREGVASRKGFELLSIYAAQGVLATKPKYFDYCAALSHDDEFVICALANPYHTCAVWERAPVGFAPKAPDADVVLVPGNPPLTRGLVADVRGFLECILNVDLSVFTARIEEHLVNEWQQNDPKLAGFLEVVAQVKAADPVTRAHWREEKQAQYVADLRNENDALSASLLAKYDEAKALPIRGG
jgi:hypothetical protein